MKDAILRDAIVSKVVETYAAYPNLSDVPRFTGEAFRLRMSVADPASNTSYVAALYELFYQNATVSLIGRVGSDLIAG